jgi:hypothetical protein
MLKLGQALSQSQPSTDEGRAWQRIAKAVADLADLPSWIERSSVRIEACRLPGLDCLPETGARTPPETVQDCAEASGP